LDISIFLRVQKPLYENEITATEVFPYLDLNNTAISSTFTRYPACAKRFYCFRKKRPTSSQANWPIVWEVCYWNLHLISISRSHQLILDAFSALSSTRV